MSGLFKVIKLECFKFSLTRLYDGISLDNNNILLFFNCLSPHVRQQFFMLDNDSEFAVNLLKIEIKKYNSILDSLASLYTFLHERLALWY